MNRRRYSDDDDGEYDGGMNDSLRLIPPSPIHSPGVSPKSQPQSPRELPPSLRLTPTARKTSFQWNVDENGNDNSNDGRRRRSSRSRSPNPAFGLGITSDVGGAVDGLSVERIPPSVSSEGVIGSGREGRTRANGKTATAPALKRTGTRSNYIRGGAALRREEDLSTALYILRKTHRWSAYGFAGFALVHMLNTGVAVLISRPGLSSIAIPFTGGGVTTGDVGRGVTSAAASVLTGFNGVLQPADDNLLSARALYHAWHPIVELGLVAGTATFHVLSGVALRCIRLFREARLYKHRVSTSPSPDLAGISPIAEYTPSANASNAAGGRSRSHSSSGSSTPTTTSTSSRDRNLPRVARVSLVQHLWSTISWTSLAGYMSIPLIASHAYLQRVAAYNADVDASAGFVAHLLNLPIESSTAGASTAGGESGGRIGLRNTVRIMYPLLVAIGSSHVVYGALTMLRIPPFTTNSSSSSSSAWGGGERRVRRIRQGLTAAVTTVWLVALWRLYTLGPVLTGFRKVQFDKVVEYVLGGRRGLA